MSRTGMALLGFFGALSTMGVAAVPASAATEQVAVFETELQPLTVYEDPEGCYKLPLAAHVLTNQTEKPVYVYGDPLCLGPGVIVEPGHGFHVPPGSGSFSL